MSKKDKVEAMEAARGTVNTCTGKTVGAVKKSDGNTLGGGRNPEGTVPGGGRNPEGIAPGGGRNPVGTAPGAVKRPEGNAADMADGREQAVPGQLELTFPPTENEKEQEAIIEAVLFTMGNSVELRQLAAAIGQDQDVARRAVERLIKRYRSSKSGMEITQLEDSYQMCTKAAYYENLIRVAATPKKQVLTEVVLETLSIIAYKQPVTKMEIEKIRGVKSDHAVNRLVEYNLVYEVGRLDAPGRPALFATTEEFLRRFGVGSVQDLPDVGPEQEAEIKAQVEEELQLKLEALPDGTGQEMAEEAEQEMPEGLERPEEASTLKRQPPQAKSKQGVIPKAG